MKPRTLLILFALVAGLGAFIWFYERDLPSSEERTANAKKLLGGLENGEVSAVEIDSAAGRVRLERVQPAGSATDSEPASADAEPEPVADSPPAEWRLVLPAPLAGTRADRFAVERLIDQWVELDKLRTFDDPDRATLGLADATRRVTFERTGGETTTVEIGSQVPGSSSVLVGITGRPEAWVVTGPLLAELDKSPGDWRDREIFPLRRDEVTGLTLVSGGERVVLSRRGEGFWLDEPLVDRADVEAVEGLLSDLVALRAVRFVDQAPAEGVDRGLDPPRASIEVAAADAADRVRIALGATEGDPAAAGPSNYFARIGDQVIVASAPLLDRLGRGAEAWQSRALSGRRLYQIDRVRIAESSAEGDDLLLRRDGADWRRGEEEIPYSPVSDLLFAVTDARAERLERRAAAVAAGARLGAPAFSLTFEGGDEPEAETVTLYPAVAGGETPATVTGRDFVLWLAPSTVEALADSIHRLREAEPIPEDEAAVDDGLDIAVEEGEETP